MCTTLYGVRCVFITQLNFGRSVGWLVGSSPPSPFPLPSLDVSTLFRIPCYSSPLPPCLAVWRWSTIEYLIGRNRLSIHVSYCYYYSNTHSPRWGYPLSITRRPCPYPCPYPCPRPRLDFHLICTLYIRSIWGNPAGSPYSKRHRHY